MQRVTMTVPEAANYIGVSPDTIYVLVKRKEIPHVRIRRRILFRMDTLDAWMARQEGLLYWRGDSETSSD